MHFPEYVARRGECCFICEISSSSHSRRYLIVVSRYVFTCEQLNINIIKLNPSLLYSSLIIQCK